ncbi:hypothetical protein BURMUCGD1_4057 [Burkholderia multivorans CGD1]|nr:hypothetical protein BURMUCGD1_4057 [Burkholderia multivorans CGD1]
MPRARHRVVFRGKQTWTTVQHPGSEPSPRSAASTCRPRPGRRRGAAR